MGDISGAANFQPELSYSSKWHQHTESEQTVVYGNVFSQKPFFTLKQFFMWHKYKNLSYIALFLNSLSCFTMFCISTSKALELSNGRVTYIHRVFWSSSSSNDNIICSNDSLQTNKKWRICNPFICVCISSMYKWAINGTTICYLCDITISNALKKGWR